MKFYVPAFFLSLLIGITSLESTSHEPEESCIQVIDLPGRDSIFLNPVYFCVDISGRYFYYSSLKTTVCNDTLCQLVLLNVFWDPAEIIPDLTRCPVNRLPKTIISPLPSWIIKNFMPPCQMKIPFWGKNR